MKLLGAAFPSVDSILRRLKTYAEETSRQYHIPRAWLYWDYLWELVFHGAAVRDYFLYQYYLKNRAGRNQFATVMDRVFYQKKSKDTPGYRMLSNKEQTLNHFSDVIRRDWCGQNVRNTPEDYASFAARHENCILKPLTGSGGEGVEIIPVESGEALYALCKARNALVEELIVQHEAINAMYPSAINTIRILTLDGKCIGAAFRIGSGGKNVDNAHAGGVFAELDMETGIVVSKGCGYEGERFLTHPDTGTVIPGFRIPMWEQCVSFAENAAKRVPEVSLIGWDIALTPDGPTLVEANNQPGFILIQTPTGNGIRQYMKK